MSGNAQRNEIDEIGQIQELQIAIQRALLPVSRLMDTNVRQGWIGCRKAKLTRMLGQQLLPPLPAVDPKQLFLSPDYSTSEDREPELTLADLLPDGAIFRSVLNDNESTIDEAEGYRRVQQLPNLLGAKACCEYFHQQDLLPEKLKRASAAGFRKVVVFAGTTFRKKALAAAAYGMGHYETYEWFHVALEYDDTDGRFHMRQFAKDQPHYRSVIVPYIPN